MTPVIISCALTGGADTVGKSPHIPVTPDQLVASAIEAHREGAAVVHIHVRDPATGKGSMNVDLYRKVVEGIRCAGCDVLLNLTTGPGARFVPGEDEPADGSAGSNFRPPEERVRHIVELRPEIATLDMGSLNFRDHVLTNTPEHLAVMAETMRDAGVLPELEIFDSGQVGLAAAMIEAGLLRPPGLFQLCMGIRWGAPATPQMLVALRHSLPERAVWAAFGVGPMAFPMVAQAMLMGGHVRVGLEDNLYLKRGELAPGNGALVAKAANIVELLGGTVATPAEARVLLPIN